MQTCYIDMAIGSLDRDTVFLVPGQLNMSESKDMPIFRMINWELKEQRFDARKHGLRLVIVMKRKVVSELMTTYFPSTLLIAITFATAFFKPFFFEAALSVNLTTMLVMTTIFISKMESLPPTSATKMIDYWLILCQLVPFTQVVLLTAIEFIKEKDQEENDKLEEAELVDVKAKSTATNIQKVEELDTKQEVPTIRPPRASSVAMLQSIGRLFTYLIFVTNATNIFV